MSLNTIQQQVLVGVRGNQKFICLGVTLFLPGYPENDSYKISVMSYSYIFNVRHLQVRRMTSQSLVCNCQIPGQSLSCKKSTVKLLFFVPVFSFRNKLTHPYSYCLLKEEWFLVIKKTCHIISDPHPAFPTAFMWWSQSISWLVHILLLKTELPTTFPCISVYAMTQG